MKHWHTEYFQDGNKVYYTVRQTPGEPLLQFAVLGHMYNPSSDFQKYRDIIFKKVIWLEKTSGDAYMFQAYDGEDDSTGIVFFSCEDGCVTNVTYN